MADIIYFEDGKPDDISPYVDYDKGWKFTEDDEEFLIKYYKDVISFCIEDCGGDGVEEPTKILNSIEAKGVEASKKLIQEDARNMAWAVNDDIYCYYKDAFDILKLIEQSILDMRWENSGQENESPKIFHMAGQGNIFPEFIGCAEKRLLDTLQSISGTLGRIEQLLSVENQRAIIREGISEALAGK